MNKEYGLGLEGKLNDQRKRLDEIRKPIDKAGPLKANEVYSPPETLTVKDALGVDQALTPISDNNLEINNVIVQAFNDRKKRWSIYYKFMYIIGTLLIILPKIIEWNASLKVVKQTKLEEKKHKDKKN